MGCYPPMGKMMSKALWKCNGKKKRYDASRTMVYSPPPLYSYGAAMARSTARNVTFGNENPAVIIVPPAEPTQIPTFSTPHPEPAIFPSPHAEAAQPKEPTHPRLAPEPDQHGSAPHPTSRTERPHVRFAVEPDQHAGAVPHPNRQEPAARVRFPGGPAPGPDPHGAVPHPNQKEPAHVRFVGGPTPGPSIHEPIPGYPGTAGYHYMMSPLPRSDFNGCGGDRRREYFSGEYNYYPTPVREGIYRIATDANRLTTIFSEENPNACSIV